MFFSSRLTWLKSDRALTILFFVVGASVGVFAAFFNRNLIFYQAFMPETVYWACGHGFVRPVDPPPAMLSFLSLQASSFNCADIGPLVGLDGAGVFFKLHLYLATSVAVLWRLFGFSHASLYPLAAMLSGAYCSGCYFLLRQFFRKIPSLVGAACLALSPVTFFMIPYLRDYSKAPFFVWAVASAYACMRAETTRSRIVWALLTGGFCGIGYGFRSDVLILIVILIPALLLNWQARIRDRAIAAVVALSAAGAFSLPIILATKAGGVGTVMLQGLADPFQSYLELGLAPYSFGPKYSDELALSSVAADLRKTTPDWDLHEGRAGPDVSQSITKSGRYLTTWLHLFSGDLVAQAFKSAAWVIGFPALVSVERSSLDPAGGTAAAFFGRKFLGRAFDAITSGALVPVWLGAFAVFVWSTMVARPREAASTVVIMASILLYPVIQFSLRHTFHLQFVWVLAVLSVFALRRVDARSHGVRMAGLLATMVLAVVLTCYGADFYQDLALKRRVTALLEAPRTALNDIVIERRSADGIDYIVPVPADHRAVVESEPDSMTPEIAGRGIQWNVASDADRLFVNFEGASCPRGRWDIEFVYAKRKGIWQPLDRRIAVDMTGEGRTVVVAPAFYRATQNFEAIRIPQALASCAITVEKENLAGFILPVTLSVILTPHWQKQKFFRAFGGFRKRI